LKNQFYGVMGNIQQLVTLYVQDCKEKEGGEHSCERTLSEVKEKVQGLIEGTEDVKLLDYPRKVSGKEESDASDSEVEDMIDFL